MTGNQVAKPCVRYDLDEAEYHADPVVGGSLSQSGAKKLLLPGGPARFHYDRHHPRPPKPHFDLGKAAHAEVLGVGAEWVASPYPDFRTKEAREWRDAQQAAGVTVLSAEDAEKVRAMAEALKTDWRIVELLDGPPEVSMFTRHETGVMLRGRADVINSIGTIDFKTTSKLASPEDFQRSTANFGYHQQAAWYLSLTGELDLCPPEFVFVVQEVEPPFLAAAYRLSPEFMQIGHDLNEKAIRIYAECVERNEWPGLPGAVTTLEAPHWLVSQHYSTLDPQLEAELTALTFKEPA